MNITFTDGTKSDTEEAKMCVMHPEKRQRLVEAVARSDSRILRLQDSIARKEGAWSSRRDQVRVLQVRVGRSNERRLDEIGGQMVELRYSIIDLESELDAQRRKSEDIRATLNCGCSKRG